MDNLAEVYYEWSPVRIKPWQCATEVLVIVRRSQRVVEETRKWLACVRITVCSSKPSRIYQSLVIILRNRGGKRAASESGISQIWT